LEEFLCYRRLVIYPSEILSRVISIVVLVDLTLNLRFLRFRDSIALRDELRLVPLVEIIILFSLL